MDNWAKWAPIMPTVSAQTNGREFFDEHGWATIEAATARIIPTDHDPGAVEANVVRFIDRYLSGLDYIYATSDGEGFLRLEGAARRTWQERLQRLREIYLRGIRELDELANRLGGVDFIFLTDERQDEVLEILSGSPMPQALPPGQYRGTSGQPIADTGLGFFDVLVLHTRQGFYGDPIYGGNENRVGWAVIGFRGPPSLASTQDCTYRGETFVQDRDWSDLIPFLRQSSP